MKRFALSLLVLVALALVRPTCRVLAANSYYLAATGGNDTNSGLSPNLPWATFAHAWTVLQPGDTLYLLDGTYYQTMQPTINGDGPLYGHPQTRYITVKALNDGQAVIDGQHQREAVVLGKTWDQIASYTRDTINPFGNYFDIEGIVAANSTMDVWEVYSRDVILRRDSGYNANPHDNYHVFTVWSQGSPANPANILLEDNVAAGSGRKMIIAYDTYVNITFRRNFAAWQWWLGDAWCAKTQLPYWPQSDGIEIYPKAYADQPDVLNNSLVENNLVFGLTPDYGTSLSPNPGLRAGNSYYGDMAIGTGMRWDNTQQKFVAPAFDSSSCTYNGIAKPAACANTQCISLANVGAYRSGFVLGSYANPLFKNNLFQDIFAWGDGGPGLNAGPWANGSLNNSLIRATLVNNSLGNPPPPTGTGVDTTANDLAQFTTKSDLKIGHVSGGSPYTGGGAKLEYEYTNGTQTATPLWPWPMENRIKKEFANPAFFQADGVNGRVWTNFSVTGTVCPILLQYGAVPSCPGGGVPIPGDLNNDGRVDISDLRLLLSEFGTSYGLSDLSTVIANFGR